MWREAGSPEAVYSDVLDLDIGSVQPSLAGPKRPQDRLDLSSAQTVFRAALDEAVSDRAAGGTAPADLNGQKVEIKDGAVVIAAITSCTNTSNPSVMMGAGLVARRPIARPKVKPWVKTGLARARWWSPLPRQGRPRRTSKRSVSTRSATAAPPSAIRVLARRGQRSHPLG